MFLHSAGTDKNCHLFGPDKDTMSDYLSSCNMVGQPTRMADDTCIADANYPITIFCDIASMCPNGCKSCAQDPCNGYAETGCVMATEGTYLNFQFPTFESCQAFAISNGDTVDNIITFFIFGQREEECRVYYTGARSCAYQVALQTMDMATITGCQT